MASNTINGTTANAYIVSKIEWSSTPSTANNNSTVTASLYYRRTNTYSGTPTSGTGSFSITIDGQSGSASTKITIPNDKSWVLALTVTKTVAHNADGKKSITISAAGSLPPSSLTSTTCSGTAVLDNIPRRATLTSAPNFTDEQNPTITYSNPAGSAVSALDACISFTGDVADIAYRPIPTGGSSYTFNLTEAERNILRNATEGNSRTVVFVVRTIIGNMIHYHPLPKTLSIVNANPTFTDDMVSYADTSAVANITGNNQHIVQSQSSLTATFGAATANKGARITGYTLSLNGVTKTASASGSVPFGAVNSSQDAMLYVTARDSRGNTTTAQKRVTVLAWSLPVVSASIERLNNYEDETHLTVDASVSSVNGKNTMAVSYQYKQSGGSYGSAVQIENKTKYTIECDKNNAYVFSITVADLFGSATKEIHLDKGKFPLFIDTEKNAVGINEFPSEGEALRVAGGRAVFEEGIGIGDATVADFVIEQGITDGWTWRKWSSGMAECWGTPTFRSGVWSGENNLYYIVKSLPLPSGVFATEPKIVPSVTRAGGAAVTPATTQPIGTTEYQTIFVRVYGGTNDVLIELSVYAYGKWK